MKKGDYMYNEDNIPYNEDGDFVIRRGFGHGPGRRCCDDNHINNKRQGKKQRLQPLSIRIKPHTKRFLKEESELSAREILELYEDYATNSEEYINSLKEDQKLLNEELEKLQKKLTAAQSFNDKLKSEK